MCTLKIGFVLSQPFGRSIGTDTRVIGLLKGLREFPVAVHVLTPYGDSIKEECISIHNISSKTFTQLSNGLYTFSKKFLDTPFFFRNIFSKKSLIMRTANSFSKGILDTARKLQLDILQAEQPIASLACCKIRDKIGIPIVADFHGVWCEEMVASNFMSYEDKSYKSLFDIESDIANSADLVTVVSEEMKCYVKESFGCSQRKVKIVPNAAFIKDSLRTPNNSPNKIIHSGTLHPWENVELFIQSMPLLTKKRPSTEYYLTRKGAKLKKIRKLARSLGAFPDFLWFNKSAEYNNFLKSCDIGVISSTSHIARKMAYPAKLYDYLSVGLPIVANDIGAWTKIIRDEKVGIVTGNTPEEYANGLLELLENPEELNEFGQRGIDLVNTELNYHRSAEMLFNLYKNLG